VVTCDIKSFSFRRTLGVIGCNNLPYEYCLNVFDFGKKICKSCKTFKSFFIFVSDVVTYKIIYTVAGMP